MCANVSAHVYSSGQTRLKLFATALSAASCGGYAHTHFYFSLALFFLTLSSLCRNIWQEATFTLRGDKRTHDIRRTNHMGLNKLASTVCEAIWELWCVWIGSREAEQREQIVVLLPSTLLQRLAANLVSVPPLFLTLPSKSFNTPSLSSAPSSLSCSSSCLRSLKASLSSRVSLSHKYIHSPTFGYLAAAWGSMQPVLMSLCLQSFNH